MSQNTEREGFFMMIVKYIILPIIVLAICFFVERNLTDKSDFAKQEDKPTSQPVNQPDNSPSPNSRDNQSGKPPGTNSTLPILPSHSEVNTEKPKEEDFSTYINPSQGRANVSVIIVDASGNLSNPASSAIAGVYQKTGKSTSVGLIQSKFIRKTEFHELCEGNSEVIQKLNLGSYADYLALGKINFVNRAGKLVDGTVICTASVSMNIISTSSKSLKTSFTISNANGNGATEDQAKEDAFQKLLDRYYNDHSSL